MTTFHLTVVTPDGCAFDGQAERIVCRAIEDVYKRQVYDYANHNRSDKVQHIEPAPVLIVEGILPFVEPELCALFDYKIYVDTDADERILRRLVRDVKERGRSLDSVIDQYLTTVKPRCV